jgi:integrase
LDTLLSVDQAAERLGASVRFVRRLEEASKLRGAWVDPRGSRRRFDDWATQWWELWASEPRRSPAALEAAESHLRLHIRPYFGRRPLGDLGPGGAAVAERAGGAGQPQPDDGLPVDPEPHPGRGRGGATDPGQPGPQGPRPQAAGGPRGRVRPGPAPGLHPEEFGRLLVGCPAFYRDHFIVQVGTGLRSGELLGLQARRVDLEGRRIEVVDVRYDAGRFGSGYKDPGDGGVRHPGLAGDVVDGDGHRKRFQPVVL